MNIHNTYAENPVPPAKLEKEEKSEGIIDKLTFKSRFVFVFGEINPATARTVSERLIALSQDSLEPINILISSPGGHVESGDAIHDMIKFVQAPVTTIGTGWVASAGTLIFLAAPKERRVCLPNTRFMIHQPSGGMGGPASDISIQAKEILRVRKRVATIISNQTNRSVEQVTEDMDRDFWMSPEEAIEYGLVSRIIENHGDLG